MFLVVMPGAPLVASCYVRSDALCYVRSDALATFVAVKHAVFLCPGSLARAYDP